MTLFDLELEVALFSWVRLHKSNDFLPFPLSCPVVCNSLLHYYSDLVSSKAPELLKTSKYLVADAYFSKKPFVDAVTESGFELISRFRNDAVLQYRYLGFPKPGRGRPRKFQGKVDVRNLDEQHFKMIIKDAEYNAYEAIVYSKALKR